MAMNNQFKKLIISSRGELHHFIQAIKSFRALSGYGLKEAKETVERIRDEGEVVTIDVTSTEDTYIMEWVGEMRKAGLFVQHVHENNPVRVEINEQIRAIISYATLAGQYDIAKSLLHVLETYCPNGKEEEKE